MTSTKKNPSQKASQKKTPMPFGKKNYVFMIAAIALLILGMFIMTRDSQEFGFGFLGLTLGPMLMMAGFIVGIISIVIKPQASND